MEPHLAAAIVHILEKHQLTKTAQCLREEAHLSAIQEMSAGEKGGDKLLAKIEACFKETAAVASE